MPIQYDKNEIYTRADALTKALAEVAKKFPEQMPRDMHKTMNSGVLNDFLNVDRSTNNGLDDFGYQASYVGYRVGGWDALSQELTRTEGNKIERQPAQTHALDALTEEITRFKGFIEPKINSLNPDQKELYNGFADKSGVETTQEMKHPTEETKSAQVIKERQAKQSDRGLVGTIADFVVGCFTAAAQAVSPTQTR